ncbi:MAG: hypothetical protein N4A76_11895 [Firmicutes bacterium]|jgi:hypothetical protein|nr:hypothetical protein [Bacillota bacterium]
MNYKKIIALALCIILSLLAVACGSKRELKREEKKLKEYLKAKYNDEFVINKLDYYIPQIGNLMIKGTASPEKDKDIVFEIISSSLDTKSSDKFGDDYRNNGHVDHYLDYLWSKEINIDYSNRIEEAILESYDFLYVDFQSDVDISGNMYLGYTPEYSDIISEYSKFFEIRVNIKYRMNNIEKEKMESIVLALIKVIRQNEFSHYMIDVSFNDGYKNYDYSIWKEDISNITDGIQLEEFLIIDNEGE